MADVGEWRIARRTIVFPGKHTDRASLADCLADRYGIGSLWTLRIHLPQDHEGDCFNHFVSAPVVNMYAAPPMMNLLVLRSPDVHRAAGFYRELGLLFKSYRYGNEPEHYTSSVNGFVFELYPLRPSDTPTTGTRIGFHMDEVDRHAESVTAVAGRWSKISMDILWSY